MNYLNQIITGDALAVLQSLPDSIVRMCVTSPPYYGLRDYNTPPLLWDESQVPCEHRWGNELPPHHPGQVEQSRWKQVEAAGAGGNAGGGQCCQVCGAWRGSLGLEPTPDRYIQHLVQIFREVRRVLRNDGTLWVNIGDSYSDSTIGRKDAHRTIDGKPVSEKLKSHPVPRDRTNRALGPKQLLGIPWRLAFALQADGWILRSDIIWHKPAAMPESVTDRPTSAHEHIFLLAKSERYYYDVQAIAEPTIYPVGSRVDKPQGSFDGKYGEGAFRAIRNTRNKRNVWTVASQPYSEAHFATFPPKLIEPCILAGSRPGDLVLDPFMGAGTTAMVALQHARNYLGIELNPEYVKMAEKRIATVQQHLWTTTGGVA